MNFRSYVLIISLFFLFAGGSFGLAEQMMTPVSGVMGPRKTIVDELGLKRYEAALGDLSLCGDDNGCLQDAKAIRSWRCAAALCDGADKSKAPITCFKGGLQQYSIGDQEKIDALICPFIKFHSAQTRKALVRVLSDPNATEDNVLEDGASLMAFRSAKSCEDYIKNYVGPYGPQWKLRWYMAISGCRILAHERTRQEEEKDFSTWFWVVKGSGNCSDIINSEMRRACSAPGATSPIPVYGK